ncbi:MAG: asparagine synthase (glutamine-hydrolyzing) [Acidimicrobiia bacterium]
MCGIAGFLTSRLPSSPSQTLSKMLRVIAHRGPDDEGRYSTRGRSTPKIALGNRRLAIIDLEGGKQPVFSEKRDVVAVFNGEIYNYKELRKELEGRGHSFASDSDSEVIPHLYEEHGTSFVERLRGMFAIAIYDGSRLVLARDRFGIKPLYYAELDSGGIAFASEPSALAPFVSLKPEPALLPTYLSLGYFPAPLTPYKDVKKLPAATVLECDGKRLFTRRWWEPSLYFEPRSVSDSDLLDAVEESVAAHTVADVPIGVFVSGGLDSSVIAALAARQSQQEIVAFTLGFAGNSTGEKYDFDERDAAAEVAEYLGLEHIALETGPPTVDDLLDLAAKYGEPIGDEAAIPTYAIAKLARQYVKVVLTGEGGDELFGGYEKYRAFFFLRPLMAAPLPIQGVIQKTIPYLIGERRASKISAILAEDLLGASRVYDEISTSVERRRLLSPELASWPVATPQMWPSLMERRRRGDLDPQWVRATGEDFQERYLLSWEELAALMAADVCGYLADGLLHKVDSATMAHGLEARVPYLDHCLFQTAAGAVAARRGMSALAVLRNIVYARSSKPALRAIATQILPRNTVARKKQGFGVPLSTWLAHFARSELGRYLADPKRLDDQGYWNTPEVLKLVQRFQRLPKTSSERSSSHHIAKTAWVILAYQLWIESISES